MDGPSSGTSSGPRLAAEFRISRAVRRRHGLADGLFGRRGDLVMADLGAARELAHELDVDAGELFALGLIHEIQHALVATYRGRTGTDPFAPPPDEAANPALRAFVEAFPPTDVFQGRRSPADELATTTDGRSNRALAREELALHAIALDNPATEPLRELFDDPELRARPDFRRLLAAVRAQASGRPPAEPFGPTLLDALRAPARARPDSLGAQLRWMAEQWPQLVAPFLPRVLLALDVLAEEARARELQAAGPFGGGARPETPNYAGLEGEPERFSPDRDWMRRLVLVAKSTFVWLDQLSRTYGREVRRLDQVPDAALAELAERGFSGLWLIGLWERSRASAEIKRRMGNPEAAASAYSVLDYRIAAELGGEGAYADLRDRAARHGLRLASDMVPNHMAIDSTWLVEHPQWFLSLAQPPFPGYRFGGPDLSPDPRVEIRLEDGYWDRTDAAVVFERRDRSSGEVRYVYHGNDGTSTPWNDTAQLDYLDPAVREQVIRTIVEVARRFPVIRFDAAMTLARRHIERLWFPEPGHGGAIPSRAEHAMTRDDFARQMPHEFWREVVDRIAAEAPDTLLLAEAFWLMEGYFVRTLGMHRVYNSAFMHMLRDERNAEFRRLIAETVAYDPRILERYVNFMNNPDEATAAEQFGDGDKYAGVATLLATLPGLPMFGHGQVEGLREKYGMEYRRAYRDEAPNAGLVGLHAWRIGPLLHRRALFAGSEAFRLFDVRDDGGTLLEDVFAYVNRSGDERALVVYHNRYGDAHGWARQSVPFTSPGRGTETRTETLAEALGLAGEPEVLYAVRDAVTHQASLLDGRTLTGRGLHVDLGAYGCRVLLDWREIRDTDGTWHRLAERLGGGSVPDLDAAWRDLRLAPVRAAYRRLIAVDRATALRAAVAPQADPDAARAWADALAEDLRSVIPALATEGAADADAEVAILRLEVALRHLGRRAALGAVRAELGEDDSAWLGLLALLVDEALGRHVGPAGTDPAGLEPELEAAAQEAGTSPEAASLLAACLRNLPLAEPAPEPAGRGRARARDVDPVPGWLAEPALRDLLEVHGADDHEWLRQEAWEAWVRWWAVHEWLADRHPAEDAPSLRERGALAGWRVDRTIDREA